MGVVAGAEVGAGGLKNLLPAIVELINLVCTQLGAARSLAAMVLQIMTRQLLHRPAVQTAKHSNTQTPQQPNTKPPNLKHPASKVRAEVAD